MWAWREAVNNRAGEVVSPGREGKALGRDSWVGQSFSSPFLGSSSSGSAALLNFSLFIFRIFPVPWKGPRARHSSSLGSGFGFLPGSLVLEAEARLGAWGWAVRPG